MTPGTLVLLHSPLDRAAAWGGVPETLRSYGLDVVVPDIPTIRGAAFVARAALIITATAPTSPLVLVGHGEAGPLLPMIGLAQRAAHRLVGAYVFIDARLPAAGGGPATTSRRDELAAPADWPDAPCGFLSTTSAYDQQARLAQLRGWPIATSDPVSGLAQSVHKLVVTL